ncbi:MAG TPA: CHAT domain-containing protein [Roseiflexaceae bacterium]|nr:CHAT domain-containing protein [Roseiflexaceae bacterium]
MTLLLTQEASPQTIAAALAASDRPSELLPDPLPCPPLDLLVALHGETTRAMLADLSHARRAAAAALAVAQRFPDDALLQAQAHWTQGTAVLYIPDYARSLEHYDVALRWYELAEVQYAPDPPPRDVRIVQIVRVACLGELGRYEEALHAAGAGERWLDAHPNDHARLTLLLNRSYLAGQMADYAGMIDLADQTIALADRLDVQERIAHGWLNRAFACIYLGRYDESARAITLGLRAAEAAGEPITAGRAHMARALLLRYTGQIFAALTELRTAAGGLAQAENEAAELARIEATVYEQLRQLPEALGAARRAAELFAGQNMPTYSANAALRGARLAIQLRQRSTARPLLDLARAQAGRVQLPVLEAEIALVEALLAALPQAGVAPRTLARQRRAAQTAAEQAVAVFGSHGMVEEAAEGLLALAALDAALGQARTAAARCRSLADHPILAVRLAANAELGRLLPPSEALPFLHRAAALAVEQRRALPMEELQARYGSETSLYHTRLAACHLALGEAEAAFAAICQAKAGPLLDLREAGAALGSDTHELLERFKADLVRWRDQEREHLRRAEHAVQQGKQAQADYHRLRAQDAGAQAQSSAQRLTDAIRTLDDRHGQTSVPTPEEVRAALAPGMAALEFAQCDADLLAFLLLPGQPIMWRRLGVYADLAPLLDRWSLVRHRLLVADGPDAALRVRQALAPLWDLLLAPWASELSGVGRLLIAPQGMLHHVPWAMLPDGETPLAERLAITLTPCTGLWAAPLPPRDPPAQGVCLLGAPGFGETHLAHVGEELAAIARHVPAARLHSQATSADLRVSPPPRLLHIAAHAHTNPSAPLCSTLDLMDGPLLLLEAHRLDLRGVELVTLSACETSVRPDYGDMVLALAGAFLCAGARAVIASLWPVADHLTARLMERCYAALAAGMTPTEALRQAQLQTRAEASLDWGAFQIWAGATELQL